MNIALATSVFADKNFDEFETISLAKEKGISAVQFYMTQQLQENTNKINQIREECSKNSLKMICHSPKTIKDAVNSFSHCNALTAIFYRETDKYCVFHFDENDTIENMIYDCKRIIGLGIIPCVENYYQDKTRQGLVANLEKYLAFFDRISVLNLEVVPVLDFPRLFVEQFINYHPIFLSELLIQKFAHKRIIIHAIDSVLPRQSREDWCAVGHGIIDWINIFEYIKLRNVFVQFAVLEYENREFIDESAKFISQKS